MTGASKRLALSPGDTLPKVVILSRPVSFDSGGTAQSLYFNMDGTKATFQAGKKFAFIDTLGCGGASGSLDTLMSNSAGTKDSLKFGKVTKYSYLNVKDQAADTTVTVNDSTSVDGGNNNAFWIFPLLSGLSGIAQRFYKMFD
jgi:hypothetical protein